MVIYRSFLTPPPDVHSISGARPKDLAAVNVYKIMKFTRPPPPLPASPASPRKLTPSARGH